MDYQPTVLGFDLQRFVRRASSPQLPLIWVGLFISFTGR